MFRLDSRCGCDCSGLRSKLGDLGATCHTHHLPHTFPHSPLPTLQSCFYRWQPPLDTCGRRSLVAGASPTLPHTCMSSVCAAPWSRTCMREDPSPSLCHTFPHFPTHLQRVLSQQLLLPLPQPLDHAPPTLAHTPLQSTFPTLRHTSFSAASPAGEPPWSRTTRHAGTSRSLVQGAPSHTFPHFSNHIHTSPHTCSVSSAASHAAAAP
jgi:hypothetical protein